MLAASRQPTLLALVLALLVAAAPGIVAGPLPQAAAALSSQRAVSREVMGFFTATERDYMLNVADYSVLSTVAFFAIKARADGHLATTNAQGNPTTQWAAWHSSWMDKVFARARAAGTRVVLTVQRFGWSATDKAEMIALLSSASRRALLASEIADAVAARGANGVNLDFEPMPAEVGAHFVTFVRQVRAALNAKRSGLYLTFDVTGWAGNYDIAKLTASDAANAVFIMGYDFHTASAARAGAVSPLSGLSYDVTDAVNRVLSQTSPGKVILGLPYYGREWSTKTKYLHSATRPQGSTYGYSSSRRLDAAIRLGKQYGVRWDKEQKVPWTRWLYRACASCPQTWRQLYYENKRSLGLKYDLVNRRNLAGVGFWRIGMEGDRPGLYQLLRDKFGP